jgi:hypothetical protein
MQHRGKRRLLFYARMQSHASRNMVELGMQALKTAIEAGDFDLSKWEFWGMGNPGAMPDIPLSRGAQLRMIPRMSLDRYYAMLREFDAGLSLMLTPHPSLTPLDMAGSGLVVLTNTFSTKTEESLKAISGNIVAVPPDLAGLRIGLREVVRRVDDFDARQNGARLNWPRDWGAAFEPCQDLCLEFFGAPRQVRA